MRILATRERQIGRPRPPVCDLCRTNHRGTAICFDHSHTSGRARGWLCDRCNRVLGLVSDDAPLLKRMAKYLEEH